MSNQAIPITKPDQLNPYSNPIGEFDSPIELPPLDMDFLNSDLGFMGDLDFDVDLDISFDDLSFPSENDDFNVGDGSDVLSSNVLAQDSNAGDWYLNDGSRVFNSSSPDSENFDGRVLVPDEGFGDRSFNQGDRGLKSNSPLDSGNFVGQVQDSGNVDRVLNSPSSDSGNFDGGVLAPVLSQGSDDCRSVVDGFLNSPSPESGVVSRSTPTSPPSSCNVQSDVVVDVDDQKVKLEEEGKGGVLKRKKGKEDENQNSNSRSNKFRKETSAVSADNVTPEEDKKKARLMRNRESAQLSRQRKKHYVEELEDKVRSMHSVIADLNGKISYIMAENASLRQQLSTGNVPPQPGVYPPHTMAAPMPYPWIPCSSYPMKPQGSQLPLVPIPRLKPRQPVSTSKSKKAESKKSEGKTKKVSSVTFLGLLFFVLLFWGLVPLVNVRYGGKIEMGSSGFGYTNGGFNRHPEGRVLTVGKRPNESHQGVGVGYHSGKSDLRECGADKVNCRRVWVEGTESKSKQDSLPSSNGIDYSGNSSEPLVASLFVPRNDKLVKIDGNLIIHSVLASEKAMASRATSGGKSDKLTVSLTNESPQTSLAIAGNLAAAFSIDNSGRHVERHMYRSPSVQQKALNSGSKSSAKETRTSATDGSQQKWFLEGLAGSILSTGMCTEVFQFDASPSANPGAIIPAPSTVNVSATNTSESVHLSKRNRRILNHLPVPLTGSDFNHTKQHAGISSQNGDFHKNKSGSSMVVSVLVDPREAGELEVDGGISPKSLSRIFVVVLIDSVKYVTYSCMLPFKGSSHLVTA
ncbi:bZIP transcription factor [Thalictrum thalictroides]|uniref:BZIP transcription factor n=1 Tax=Thalictrum thalictroides TaxID=46969 RepID=A0A7J6WL41_THATH|nr:bZIP transcription factor [Thalictrum thalictroides]